MILWLTRFSLLCILAGTILLAYSIVFEKRPVSIRDVGTPKWWDPARAMIVPLRFRVGLGLIVLGTLLQLALTFV